MIQIHAFLKKRTIMRITIPAVTAAVTSTVTKNVAATAPPTARK